VVHVQVHTFTRSGFSGFLLLIHHSGSRSDSFLGFLLLIHHVPASWHSGSLLLIHHVLVVHVQVFLLRSLVSKSPGFHINLLREHKGVSYSAQASEILTMSDPVFIT
jgi:hypothetical protein